MWKTDHLRLWILHLEVWLHSYQCESSLLHFIHQEFLGEIRHFGSGRVVFVSRNDRKLEKCYQVHGMGSDPQGRIFDRVDLLRQVNLHSSILDREDHPSSSLELLIFAKVVDEVEHHALHGITCSQRVWQVITVCICASVTQWENFTIKRWTQVSETESLVSTLADSSSQYGAPCVASVESLEG